MKNPIRAAAAIAAALLTSTTVTAQTMEFTIDGNDDGSGIVHPLAPHQITQNASTNINRSAFCGSPITYDSGYWRVFDLDADHGLTGQFCVESVDYGIHSAIGPTQNLTANVFCLDDGLPFVLDSLNLVGTNAVPQPDAVHQLFNIEVGGCCDADTQRLVVELLTDDCTVTGTCTRLRIGMNDAGQTAPTYWTAEDCGHIEPVDLADIWEDEFHVIMVVNGQDEIPDVPATTGVGSALLLLIVVGSGVYFMRGRATG